MPSSLDTLIILSTRLRPRLTLPVPSQPAVSVSYTSYRACVIVIWTQGARGRFSGSRDIIFLRSQGGKYNYYIVGIGLILKSRNVSGITKEGTKKYRTNTGSTPSTKKGQHAYIQGDAFVLLSKYYWTGAEVCLLNLDVCGLYKTKIN